MKIIALIAFSLALIVSCGESKSNVKKSKIKQQKNYIFFLHNRFVEEFGLEESHPQFGKAEYREIVANFRKDGFIVISETRKKDTDPKAYALKVKTQIDSLLKIGIEPNHVTVIGTSKGGYIAQYVSTYLKNPDVNYVFIGSYMDSDIEEYPDINFCGNILTIYEKTDPSGVSASRRKETSKLKVTRFKEIELNTGLRHGFLFHPMVEWMIPCKYWARGDYGKVKSSETKI